MALVRVAGNAWDHSRRVIPAELEPRLWAAPSGDRISGSLLTGTKSRAIFQPSTGAFYVDLESGLTYRMEMDWLIPGQAQSATGDYARNRAQWPEFNAGGGGDISDLFPPVPTGTIVAALGKPPAGTKRVVWIDLTDVTPDGALVYGQGGN